MKKLLIILSLFIATEGSILAMQKETQITLISKDGKQINIARETAQKIPTIQDLLEMFPADRVVPLEKFDAVTLLHVIGIVRNVYYHAPVLKLDPQFFEQTDKHPAYTPTDIPEQVRNIINAQNLQDNIAFMQAADFLGLDWVQIAMQGGFSIADLIVHNQLDQNYMVDLMFKIIMKMVGIQLPNNSYLNLVLKKITNIAGFHLFPQDIRNNLQVILLGYNQLTAIPDNTFAGFSNLIVLYLGHNQLTTISDNTFAGLSNLGVLDLSYNPLTTISNNAFANLNNLRQLILRGNQLDQETKDRIHQTLPGVIIEF